MKKALGLLAVCLLLFGCIGGDSEAGNQTNSSVFEASVEAELGGLLPESEGSSEGGSGSIPAGLADGSPMWAGTFTVHMYGGGKEKSYDMTLTGVDELYFDEEEDAFDVLQSTYTCTYSESSDLDMGEGMPSMTMSRTGSGTITKEYGEDEFRLYFNKDGSASADFSEPDDDWVQLSLTFNGDTSSEEGGCLIDDFNDVLFTGADFEDLVIDELGRDSIRGQKKVTSGSASIEFSFEYHRVEE